MLQVKELTNNTELSDGLTLDMARVYVFASGNTAAYVPLEPNPLGFKARLVFTDIYNKTVEIDNYERRSVALWNYADYLNEPEALFNDADELFKAGF